jgi:hypothetical protein
MPLHKVTVEIMKYGCFGRWWAHLSLLFSTSFPNLLHGGPFPLSPSNTRQTELALLMRSKVQEGIDRGSLANWTARILGRNIVEIIPSPLSISTADTPSTRTGLTISSGTIGQSPKTTNHSALQSSHPPTTHSNQNLLPTTFNFGAGT